MFKFMFPKKWVGFNYRKYTTNNNSYGSGIMIGLGFILLWKEF